jgi:hypothetical protein
MRDMTVSDIAGLTLLKKAQGLNHVVLETGGLKRRNLLRHAIKYAHWALARGGRLEIRDDGPLRFDLTPGTIPFPQVRQQVFKLLGQEAVLEDLDDAARRIVMRRVNPSLPPGFGAGIIFSGHETEIPALNAAVAGLRRQPELAPEAGGQIMICGPAASRHLIGEAPDVSYLPFENPPGSRAFITRKKNALVDALQQSRVIIQHARITLAAGCLAALPREFDVLTPRVEYHEAGRVVPYLDWMKLPVLDGEETPRGLPSRISYDRSRYLGLMAAPGRATIDGGLFIARRALAQAVPLNSDLAWGEAEDAEWSARLHAAGALIDLAPEALALSQSCKLPRRYIDHPRLTRAATPAFRLLKRLIA